MVPCGAVCFRVQVGSRVALEKVVASLRSVVKDEMRGSFRSAQDDNLKMLTGSGRLRLRVQDGCGYRFRTVAVTGSGRLWAGGGASLQGGVGEASGEQDDEDSADAPGGAVTGLDQPPEVDDGGKGGDIDEAMEALPGLAAHRAQDDRGAGEGEGEEDEPGEKADLNEAALLEIVPDGGPDEMPLGEEIAGVTGGGGVERSGQIEAGEEEDVGGEVEGGVEEGVETDESAKADQETKARGEAADGGDGERAEQDPERPVAGEVGDVVDRIGVEGERTVLEDEEQVEEGRKETEVEGGFESEDGWLGHKGEDGWISKTPASTVSAGSRYLPGGGEASRAQKEGCDEGRIDVVRDSG